MTAGGGKGCYECYTLVKSFQRVVLWLPDYYLVAKPYTKHGRVRDALGQSVAVGPVSYGTLQVRTLAFLILFIIIKYQFVEF